MQKNVFSVLLACCFIFLGTDNAFSKNTLNFGKTTAISPSESVSHYHDLSNYIVRKLNMQINFRQDDDYKKMNMLISQGKIDLAVICAGALLDMERTDYKIAAFPVVRGKSTYNSYIIAPEKTGIKTVGELKGRTFVYSDSLSNSGALYPAFFIKKNTGFEPGNFFSKIYFSGNHGKSIYLVNNGVVSGAAINSLVYEYFKLTDPSKIANIRVINVSPEFSVPPIVASGKMSAELFQKIQSILTDMHNTEEGRKILNSLFIDKFLPPDEYSLDNIESMRQFVRGSLR